MPHDLVADGLRIEPTPAGPTASVRTPDGRWIRLHSGRDPVAEAERMAAAFLQDTAPASVICVGIGLGYLVEAIERRSPTTRILALEPLPSVASAMLARRDWRDDLASGRLTLLVGPEFAGASEAWRCLGADIAPPTIVAPVLTREFAAEIARARKVCDRIVFGARANAEARRTFAPRYLLNTIRNFAVISESADVAVLDDTFAGVPAIVVAAGPSLDRTIGELRAAADKALIIAVETTLRPLLGAGIAPHLVVAVDPSEVNARHLRNLGVPPETWLVAEGSLDSAAFDEFDGRTFTFSVSDHHPWPWLRSVGLERGMLRAWGSVLTSAFDLALRAGCDPIVFTGADLAYSEGRPYCRGTAFEHDWASRAAAGEPLHAIWSSIVSARATAYPNDVHGRPVATSALLLAFRDWVVEQIARCADRRFINATGGGVLEGRRIEQQSLASAVGAMRARPSCVEAVREAWSRGGAIRRRCARELQQRLPAIAEREEPIASWLAFAGPGVTHDAIAAAIRDAAHAPGRTREQHREPTPVRARLAYEPERVAAIRSAIVDRRCARSDAANGAADGHWLAAAAVRAGVLLARLLDYQDELATTRKPGVGPANAGVPASRAFEWSPAVKSVVVEYETALSDMLVSPLAPRDAAFDSWLRQIVNRIDGQPPILLERVTPESGADIAARLALIADWLSVLAVCDGQRGEDPSIDWGSPLPLHRAAAVVRAYAELFPAAPRADAKSESAIVLSVDARRRDVVCDVASARHTIADALTGALMRAVPSSSGMDQLGFLHIASCLPESRVELKVALPLLSPFIGELGEFQAGSPSVGGEVRRAMLYAWMTPVTLTGAELHRCWIGGVHDDSHALFTPAGETRSVRIGPDGNRAHEVEWPRPICGQVAWSGSGAVAWHNDGAYVMWRSRASGEVGFADLPFVASLAFPQPDGSVWWTGFNGGLWSWTPGGSWHRLVDTPPVFGMHSDGRSIRLDPAGQDPTFVARPTETHAYSWTPGTEKIERVPLGPQGPCWSASSAGGWTALAYPRTDLVLLRHQDGTEHAMTCRYPFCLAWAGPSLVVSARGGELLLFRDLRTWLERNRRAPDT